MAITSSRVACLLLAMSLSAHMGTTTNQISTLGNWPLCEVAPQLGLCSGFQAGSESYLLLIHGNVPSAAYRYTFSFVRMDGTAGTLAGVVERADNEAGVTAVALPTQGVLKSYSVDVESLAVVR